MCGIAGVFAESTGRPLEGELMAMIGTLRHRGPDAFGFHIDPPIGLAHSRLSIIDLAGGSQPLADASERIWLVFNGEIFDYLEQRARLERLGYRFRTNSDTEVIVQMYRHHQEEFVKQLNGQFALALWDAGRQRLILARDRTGIRPLFFATIAGKLYFASEAKALLALPQARRQLNLSALAEVMTFWSALPPATLFEGIEALEAGTMLVLEQGKRRLVRYWDWSFPEQAAQERSLEASASELEDRLYTAVRLQLRSDVPVGTYISGGLDSAIITAVASRLYPGRLQTFSLTFEEAEFDESPYQREVARLLGTSHREVACRKQDIADSFRRAIWHAETALVRTAPIPLLLLSERVRAEGCKVVLTGEGSDEVFAGYDLFKEAKIRRFWSRQPNSVIRPALLQRLYPYLSHSPSATPFAQRFFGADLASANSPLFGHLPRWTTTQRALRFLSEEARAALSGFDPMLRLRDRLPSGFERWAPLCRDQYLEAHTLLSGYLLSSQGDRMAMANSVEARFPFLDPDVIDFANHLPARYKLMGLREKFILKQALGHLVPASVLARPKQPYRSPDSQAFFIGSRPVDYVTELLSTERLRQTGYFNPAAVSLLTEKCRHKESLGFADNQAFVVVLSTQMLDDLFLRRESRLPESERVVHV